MIHFKKFLIKLILGKKFNLFISRDAFGQHRLMIDIGDNHDVVMLCEVDNIGNNVYRLKDYLPFSQS